MHGPGLVRPGVHQKGLAAGPLFRITAKRGYTSIFPPTSLELFLALRVTPESDAMSKNAACYRGYRIEGVKVRQGWLLRISPERPELPILPRAEFRTKEKIWPLAVANGVARIDALLPARKQMPGLPESKGAALNYHR